MDKIPEVGESFEFQNMEITVTKADEKIVDEIKIVFKEEKKED